MHVCGCGGQSGPAEVVSCPQRPRFRKIPGRIFADSRLPGGGETGRSDKKQKGGNAQVTEKFFRKLCPASEIRGFHIVR